MAYIFHNDQLIDTASGRFKPESMLRCNYIYAPVTTDGYEPLYLDRHLYYASRSYDKLFGMAFVPDAAKIAEQIRKLLYYNNLSKTGNIIHIYFIRSEDAESILPEIIIAHYKSTLYKGYELASLRPKAVVVNYEIPFSGDRTAISLLAADYMDNYAAVSGANVALRTGRSGKLLSSGDYPVFVAGNGKVFVPAAASGGESVERELMMNACELAGIETEEKDVYLSELASAEEIIVFDGTGLRCVLSIGEHYYYNLIADRLQKVLHEINRRGYSLKA